jgi:hypothetical protein
VPDGAPPLDLRSIDAPSSARPRPEPRSGFAKVLREGLGGAGPATVDRVRALHDLVHTVDDCAASSLPVRSAAHFIDALRVGFDWPELGLLSGIRAGAGLPPIPSKGVLAELLGELLPPLIASTDPRLRWEAGHLAWHLRDHGGRALAARAGYAVEEFEPAPRRTDD